MNYISEINRFYDWLETNQLPKSAIALWHGLMHIANKTGWEDKFTVAISTIESKTGFKRSELFEARNLLTQKGRVRWSSRGGNLAAEYEIIPFCVHNTDAIAYAKAYTSADTIPYANPTQKGIINKLNYTNTKLNSIDVPEGTLTPQNNFDNPVKKITKAEKESRAGAAKIFEPPTMEDVKKYFTEKMYRPNGAGGWMPDTIENEAFKFWHHYNSNGWVQARGKKIKNWHSSVALWISNCKAGTFAGPGVAASTPPASYQQLVKREASKPTLNDSQVAINYLFERYCENPEQMTYLSFDCSDYDKLKQQGRIAFSDERALLIKNQALLIIAEKNMPNTPANITTMMKKIGILEFFKDQKEAGAPAIYC